jgi:hypothetical protein
MNHPDMQEVVRNISGSLTGKVVHQQVSNATLESTEYYATHFKAAAYMNEGGGRFTIESLLNEDGGGQIVLEYFPDASNEYVKHEIKHEILPNDKDDVAARMLVALDRRLTRETNIRGAQAEIIRRRLSEIITEAM